MIISDIKIDEIIPYVNNPRINDNAVDFVAASIKEFGFKVPIVIDKDNVVVCGHSRLKAAKKLGLESVPCLRADDLTDQQIKAFRLADNKVSEYAVWDLEKLDVELESIDLDMVDFGFDSELSDEGAGLEVVEDEAPELPAEPKAKLGDLYKLGRHRLICGDCTNSKTLEILMGGQLADMVFTDPPYGVSANGGRGDTKRKLNMQEIINDDLRQNDLYDFLKSSFSIMPIKSGANIYICYQWTSQEEFTKAIKDSGLILQNCIIWRKNVFGLNGFKGYRPQYEMIYFCSKDKDYQWYGDLAQSNVWDFNRSKEHFGNHPTPKPIELIAKALQNSSKKDDVVLDVFGGSGSTLIACEQLNRSCYMCELDPRYIDVIIKRWEDFTGQKAELIKE